jgi:hypothetical protein
MVAPPEISRNSQPGKVKPRCRMGLASAAKDSIKAGARKPRQKEDGRGILLA